MPPRKRTFWPSPEALPEAVSPHQREIYAQATAGAFGILGGNPGTGKTFLTASIIKTIVSTYGLGSTAIMAPTGKASQRLNELLREHGVTSLGATTIHRALGVSKPGYDGTGWEFTRGPSNVLPYRFVFVDEASMLSVDLASSLFSALASGAHVLLVGDFFQLPPVDHGAPLRDLIAAGVPYGELTEVRRNSGDIVRACAEIKEGKPMRPSQVIDLENGGNFIHYEANTQQQAINRLIDLFRGGLGGDKYHQVWDMQVICATNATREKLNLVLQNVLNTKGKRLQGEFKYRIGDKVINTSNSQYSVVRCSWCNAADNFMEWSPGNTYECLDCHRFTTTKMLAADYCANGEMGRVVEINPGFIHVLFDAPARTVRVNKVSFGDWELAYAITCHKSQGSQWPIVIVITDTERGGFGVTSMEWHRTAWSRASKGLISIGKLGDIHTQCKRHSLKQRKTFLVDRYAFYAGNPQLVNLEDAEGAMECPSTNTTM